MKTGEMLSYKLPARILLVLNTEERKDAERISAELNVEECAVQSALQNLLNKRRIRRLYANGPSKHRYAYVRKTA
jgi:predicted transcriptional regulator